MKIALFGAAGVLGQRILEEALNRKHEVTAVVRDPKRFDLKRPHLKVVKGDALDPAAVAAAASGHDVIINVIGPGAGDPKMLVDAAKSLIAGAKQAGVRRLIVSGGAGSLEVAPGLQLVDAPDFPEAWKGVALAHRDALEVYKKADLDWTYVSPAAFIAPGERTGKFRLGIDQLLTDSKGESRISAEDFAIALLDEVERPKSLRKRMTAAY